MVIKDTYQKIGDLDPDETIAYKPKAQSQGDKNPWVNGEYDHYDFHEALDHGLDYSDEKRVGKEL